ncbi:hypothetical protein N3K66_000470 [Trichothecium roseum]|uniref:Uncharacterized protein n=1 Tax=Trichothecium roseum TaxID=47278 RepID=A0ACC0VBV4_9HYPO|nr:hypothetical protein N3K66_000470 [Trichothecium roseum]
MSFSRVNGLSRAVRCQAAVASRATSTLRNAFLQQTSRAYATEADEIPPYLTTLKGKLKESMRAKAGPRLAVLRAIMSANLNASKTKKPIRTDADLMQMIWGMKTSLTERIKEAAEANRQDLVAKQEHEMSIIDEYIQAGPIKPVSDEEMVAEVKRVVGELVSQGVEKNKIMSEAMKIMNSSYKEKLFDRKALAKVVGEEAGKV